MFFLYKFLNGVGDFINLNDLERRSLNELKVREEELHQKIKLNGGRFPRKKEVSISDDELREIRKKVEKILFKTNIQVDSRFSRGILDFIFNSNSTEDDMYILELMNDKKKYNLALEDGYKYGETEEDLISFINDFKDDAKETGIMVYRFRDKLTWKEVSEKVCLSVRQCQRIKDKYLNSYIMSCLKDEEKILYGDIIWEHID